MNGTRRHRWQGARRRATLTCVCVCMATLGTACSGSVNPGLPPTATPYPIRGLTGKTPGAVSADALTAVATGQALLDAGDRGAAEVAFGTAIAGAPALADAFIGRAAARAARGDLNGARADLDHALSEEPDNAAAYVARAELTVAIAQGDPARYQDALSDTTRALALAPDFPPARLARALVYAGRAEFRGDSVDWDRALREVGNSPAASTDPAALALRARLLAAKGDSEGARSALAMADQALASDTSPIVRAAVESARASVQVEAGQWDAAVVAANKALGDDPARWDAYRALSEAELRHGNPEAALMAADRLLATLPNDGRALYRRGVALAALGRPDEARAALNTARTLLAASPVYQAKIAQAMAILAPSASPVG